MKNPFLSNSKDVENEAVVVLNEQQKTIRRLKNELEEKHSILENMQMQSEYNTSLSEQIEEVAAENQYLKERINVLEQSKNLESNSAFQAKIKEVVA